jgi:phosphate transport system substrate-binding protein
MSNAEDVPRGKAGKRRFWMLHALILALALPLLPLQNTVARPDEATPVNGTIVPYQAPDGIEKIRGIIVSDGSSTVWPMTDEAAVRFGDLANGVRISVGVFGSGAGFRKFCDGEIDIANASRLMNEEEEAECAEAGIESAPFMVAYDGITVVVNPSATFIDCLTTEQLRQIWMPDSEIDRWSEIDPNWPDNRIDLVGPGPASGTYDYFTGVIVGEEGVSRADYFPSEIDLDLVEEVATDENAIGFFGYAYFEQYRDRLKAIAIDSGTGCVDPSLSSIADGTYAPLSRPLFIYVALESLLRPEAQEFVQFYLANAHRLAEDVGSVPLSNEQSTQEQQRFKTTLERLGNG